jgi:hypothetical protein
MTERDVFIAALQRKDPTERRAYRAKKLLSGAASG